MNDPWIERLSDYLESDPDEQMSEPDRHALEAHLASCDACRHALSELREVISLAATAPHRPPASDLWPLIASRLDPAPRMSSATWRDKRWSLSFLQLAAAALLLVGVSAGIAWFATGRLPTSEERAAQAERSATVIVAASTGADPEYDAAVADLQAALDADRSRLDPETVRIIELNLAIIDRAVADAQHALAADPGNLYLHGHLAASRQRKLALLRRAAALADREG